MEILAIPEGHAVKCNRAKRGRSALGRLPPNF